MTIKAVVFDAYGTLYDIQSVAAVTEQAFPGYGDIITQIWRIKQLEYSWLRSLMRRYEDFSVVTRESLAYTLRCLGLTYDEQAFADIMDKYLHLDLYPDALASLSAMKDRKLAILSNGSPGMLDALVRNSGLGRYLDAVISVDAKKVFKPDPRAYELIQERLNVAPDEVVFVSSNGFDVAGARSFGFKVARIERVTPAALRTELTGGASIGPPAMFRALRTQTETFGFAPDAIVDSLMALPGLIGTFAARSGMP